MNTHHYTSVEFGSDGKLFFKGVHHQTIQRKHAELELIFTESGLDAHADWLKLQQVALTWARFKMKNCITEYGDNPVYQEYIDHLKYCYSVYHAQRSEYVNKFNALNKEFSERLHKLDNGQKGSNEERLVTGNKRLLSSPDTPDEANERRKTSKGTGSNVN